MCGGGGQDTLVPSFAIYEKPPMHDRQKTTDDERNRLTKQNNNKKKPRQKQQCASQLKDEEDTELHTAPPTPAAALAVLGAHAYNPPSWGSGG